MTNTPLVPPKMDPKDFERVPTNQFIPGTLVDIEFEKDHEFKGKFARVGPAVRLSFEVDGLKFPHKSSWMSFKYDEKSNLFKNYLVPLVTGIRPYAEFDLKQLVGMRVNMIWQDDTASNFQNITLITPLEKPFAWVKTSAPAILPGTPSSFGAQPPAPAAKPSMPFGTAESLVADIQYMLIYMSEGNTEEAGEHLKVLSGFIDENDNEKYVTLESLPTTSLKWLQRIHKKTNEAFEKRKAIEKK